MRDTVDVWRNLQGGVAVGYTTLNKAFVGATLNGETVGLPGFTAHASILKPNDETLSSSRTGDIQTASNIEGVGAVRLFDIWADQQLGGGASVRVGLMDLNETFDSIDPASLFLNSSHGIGADIARSGLNGPSIFPVSALGLQLGWTVTKALSLHAAAFDAVPGDLARPKRFVAVKLDDGALLIGQADYHFGKGAQASLGVWGYTEPFDAIADPGRRLQARPGVYGSVEGPLPGPWKPRGWLRAGTADGRVQAVSGYFGAGVVWTPPTRPKDKFGLAVARAVIGGPAQRAQGLPKAETSWEASYSYQLNGLVTLQPDVQYIVNPAGGPGRPDALAVGLRVQVEFDRAD
jgi:porin